MEKPTIIDFIRHGEPVGGRMYRGNQVDHPLSELGRQQMQNAISDRLNVNNQNKNKFRWEIIISSPLLRCYTFAEELSQQLSLPLVSNKQLTEISFGEWEGKTATQIQAMDSNLFNNFQLDPVKNRPPGAESLEAFSKRINDALLLLVKEYRGKRILLVTHAGIMRTVVIQVLSAPLEKRQKFRFPYAGMLRLDVSSSDIMSLEFL